MAAVDLLDENEVFLKNLIGLLCVRYSDLKVGKHEFFNE